MKPTSCKITLSTKNARTGNQHRNIYLRWLHTSNYLPSQAQTSLDTEFTVSPDHPLEDPDPSLLNKHDELQRPAGSSREKPWAQTEGCCLLASSCKLGCDSKSNPSDGGGGGWKRPPPPDCHLHGLQEITWQLALRCKTVQRSLASIGEVKGRGRRTKTIRRCWRS